MHFRLRANNIAKGSFHTRDWTIFFELYLTLNMDDYLVKNNDTTFVPNYKIPMRKLRRLRKWDLILNLLTIEFFYNFMLQQREWIFVFVKYLLQIVEKMHFNYGYIQWRSHNRGLRRLQSPQTFSIILYY
jgi:hypothetical protein